MLRCFLLEPVERGTQFVGDLRETRVRSDRVARQCRRPSTRHGAFGEARKDLLAAALPVTAVDMNEARRLGVTRGIEIPLGALARRIGEVQVLWTLLAERLRRRRPA